MSRFCPAPWINISTDVNGSIRPCCRYEQPIRQIEYKMPWMKDGTLDQVYNSPEMNKLRNAFRNGVEPKECSWCWKEEKSGIKSFREKYIERNYIYDENNPVPQIYDLKLSNVCNLKCRMCGPQASSSIAKEEGVSNEYWLENKIIGTENEDIFFNEWLPSMQELELTGGEPFFSPENKQLIERIVDSGHADHINILITTNAMFYLPKLMEKLSSFKRVAISLSIDDIGARLEYARAGAKWDLIQKNITSILEKYPTFNTSIYRTINNYNIFYLNELDDWALENNVKVSNGILHEPKHLSIQNLPKWAKEEVTERFIRSNKYKNILDFMNIDNTNEIQSFRNTTLEKDNVRKQSFKESFPEWGEILLW